MAESDYNDSGSEADLDGSKKQRRSAAGRKLMRWNPDVDQYVLLAVEIACSEKGQPVPWNYVAEKLNEHVTGEGIKQHLAKVRKYREENGRPVPQKASSKGGNRKAAAYGTGVTNTPQRTPKKKKNGDEEAPLTGKGAGLLWSNPRAKAPKQPKEPNTPKETKEPKEKKPTEAKKKAQGGDAAPVTPKTPAKKSRKSNVKADIKADDDEKVTNMKKSTGKRGRAKKEPSVKDEDADADGDEDFENESPTKKQRVLRETYHVNYNENEIAGFAGDEYEEEDIFEARSHDSGDGAYDDGLSGSQPNTGLKSEGASSRSSRKGMTTPVQPPPNFDNMLHSRTGIHAYGTNYMDENQGSNYGGPFTGLNNKYGPGGFDNGQAMGMGGDDMMSGYGSQFNDLSYLTADQLQMLSQNNGYGGYGNAQHAHGAHVDVDVPVRKARKQESRRDDETGDGIATPLSKKDKKKHQDSTKQTPKQKTERKIRKDSAHGSDNGGEQQAAFFNDENFGNIPITNDTGRGFGHGHGHGFGTGMPSFSMPLTTYDPQQGQTLTASPTDISNDFKFPAGTSNFQNSSTGITPHFNNFSFGDGNGNSADYAIPSVEFGGGFGSDQYGGMATLNSSFSNSTDASTTGSQFDQTMPGMQYGADGGAGLGLGDVWMPGMGMGMDMSGDGEQDHDMFSMLNHDGYH